MLSKLWNRRPQPAMVVSVIALIVALGGVAGAQSGLIGPNQIANNAIKDKHVGPNQIGQSEIRNNAVRTAELAPGSVRTTDINPGAVTPERMTGGPSVSLSRVGNTDSGAIPAGACTLFQFPKWSVGADGYDSHGFLQPNGTFLEVPSDGIYAVSFIVPWDDTPGGWRDAGVGFDPVVGPGSTVARARAEALPATDDGEGLVQSMHGTVEARAGDLLVATMTSCNHSSTVGLSTDVPARFSVTWIRPLVS